MMITIFHSSKMINGGVIVNITCGDPSWTWLGDISLLCTQSHCCPSLRASPSMKIYNCFKCTLMNKQYKKYKAIQIICLLVDCTLFYYRTCAFRSDSSSFSFETSSFVSLSNSSFEWRLLKIEYKDMKVTSCANTVFVIAR